MYKRRIIVFLVIVGLVLVGLASRLWYLQFLQADVYLKGAEQYLRDTEMMLATRGQILDRRGRILAIDEPCFDLSMEYSLLAAAPQSRWVERQVKSIARAKGLKYENADEAEYARLIYRQRVRKTWDLAHRVAAGRNQNLSETVSRIIRRIHKISRGGKKNVRELYESQPIVRGLDEKSAAALRPALSETVGMSIRANHERRYPRGQAACHVVGVIGQVDPNEQASYNRPRNKPDWLTWQRESYLGGDIIGKSGVERMCEKILRGRRGYRIERAGEIVKEVLAEPGGNVHLTLDVELQEKLMEIWQNAVHLPADARGSIVVLDVPRGDVLALVSIPTYDLNRYHASDYFQQLINDKYRLPLYHRAINGRYPPGSAAKVITALAGLCEDVITPETTFDCQGQLSIDETGRRRFRCLGRHGDVQLVYGIRKSCNVYFYNVGERLGVEQLQKWFALFGFGEYPGIGLPAEGRGVLGGTPSRNQARMMGIGQGPVDATPLQVANAMATIARDGIFLSPVLVLEGGPERIRYELGIPQEHLKLVKKGMYQVVNDPGGTGYAYAHDPEIAICGKTGTAETSPQWVDKNNNGRIDTGELFNIGRDMAWFAGFAPYKDPKIAFAVLVEYVSHGGGGSHAGPIALEVVRACKRLGYVK